ncbi:MAG: AAA family ATPase [Burkholderiaceae bacterium]|nr:AAA family ATPase [Burkholderiaceae bacterium]
MRIDHITLTNYRCFSKLRVDFHPQMTVLVASNGQGKTTVLDGVKVALWPFVAGFDMGSTTNDVTGIHIDDVRREQVRSLEMDWRLPASISADGFIRVEQLIQEGSLLPGPKDWPESDVVRPWQVHRSRDKIKKGTKTKDAFVMGSYEPRENDHGLTIFSTYETALKGFAESLQRRIFSEQPALPDDLPMLGFYGTGRLWSQKKLTTAHEESNPETQSRTFAYRDCLDPASSYKHFAIWFTRAFRSLRDAQIQRIERGQSLTTDMVPDLTAPIRAIQQAIDTLLHPHTGWHTLEYSAEFDELVLHHDTHGKLMVRQLSDGIRNMLAMVGDIAYRCYKLNAHHGDKAAKQTHGIVMIDEVDMHLHPRWQQTVLNDLSVAFPKLQFIVTTHSPQVLSTIRRENIRVLSGSSAEMPLASTYGQPSGDVMHSVMLVDPQPPIEEKQKIDRLTALVDQGHWNGTEAQSLLQQLTQTLGPENARLQQLLRSIRRQEALARLSKQ